ncbi:MAG: hypothetical protein J6Q85_05370 [Clostridia bacterium]|nr:hypothetical protein [Clostridia bacterium]
MLNLIIKDFKLMFGGPKNAGKRLLSLLLKFLLLGGLIAAETFLFTAILDKIGHYKNAPRAFMVLFLLVVSAFMTVSAVFQAKKLFFDEGDIRQLATHPISNATQILSKLVFLFLVHFASSFLFVYPLFLAYGIMMGKTMMFYYLALFYPAAAFIFEAGIGLIFVYPLWYVLQYLKKHVLLEFAVSVVLLFLLSWVYSEVLTIFVGVVANNELMTLFSAESIAAIVDFEQYVVPINFLADVFIGGKRSMLMTYLAVAGGVFVLGLTVTIFTFHRVKNMSVDIKPAANKRVHKPLSVTLALVKKELSLITRNSDYVYSYSGLLVVQPLLLYLIIMAMNTIFSTGSFLYYTSLFPNFVSIIDVFVVMMFTVIISSGANQYISMEEKTIKNLKTMPVGFRKQIYIKLLIPVTLSTLSLLCSVIVLRASGVFSDVTAVFAFLISEALLLTFDLISLGEELQIRHQRPRSTFLSSAASYIIPAVYLVISLFLSYSGFDISALYIAGILFLLLIGIPYFLVLNSKMGKWFLDLEAIN